MDKIHYPKGLIRYTTENSLFGVATHWLRPRVLAYGVAIIGMCILLLTQLALRVPLQLDVIKDRGQLYVLKDDGSIENSYTLNIINMDNKPHVYQLSIKGVDGIQIVNDDVVSVQSGEARMAPIRLKVNAEQKPIHSQDIYFSAKALGNEKMVTEKQSRFIVPSP